MVLFDEIVDDRLLVTIYPAGQDNYEEVEGLNYSGHCMNILPVVLPDNNIMKLARREPLAGLGR
jgi:hypothetical protein